MPGFDGSGPLNQGPMTGRGRGICNGNRPSPGFRRFGRNGSFGPGKGCGRGRGFGFRAYSYPQGSGQTEINKAYLEEKAAYLQDELNAIHDELANMNDKTVQDSTKDVE